MKLKELRLKNNLSQLEVSKLFKITRATYSNYELENTQPDIDLLKKIATFYNVTLDYLCDHQNNNMVQIFSEEEKTLLANYNMLNSVNKIKANAYILGMLANQ